MGSTSLRDHLPGFVRHADRSTAGMIWAQDSFSFIHDPLAMADDKKSNAEQKQQPYAVIIPWWGFESRLVIDLVCRAPLSPEEYDRTGIEKSYRKRIKASVIEMSADINSNKANSLKNERPRAAEQLASRGSILHHAGLLQMTELEASLRVIKAAHFPRSNIDSLVILRKVTATLHRLGFDEEGELRTAARNGELDRIRELLSKGVDVNWGCQSFCYVSNIDPAMSPALHCAVESGHVDAVKVLLECDGIDVNAKDNEGQSPLFKVPTMDVLETLLDDPRIDLNVTDDEGTALYKFCSEGDKSFVEKLLSQHGADLNIKRLRNGTCLHSACEAGRHELIPMLLKAGCDVNAKTFMDKTPLYSAVEKGNMEVVRTLLQDAGVELGTRPKSNRYKAPAEDPAICVAIKANNDVEIAKLLLGYPGIDAASVKICIGVVY